MVIATYLLDAAGKERLVVELNSAGAVLEHRYATPKGSAAKVIEYGPQCDELLHFADMVQENVFAKMPCDECLECRPSCETDEVPAQESEGDRAPADQVVDLSSSSSLRMSRARLFGER